MAIVTAVSYGASTRPAQGGGPASSTLAGPSTRPVVSGWQEEPEEYVPEPTTAQLELMNPTRCIGRDGCGANPAKGTSLCIGHARSLGKALVRVGW